MLFSRASLWTQHFNYYYLKFMNGNQKNNVTHIYTKYNEIAVNIKVGQIKAMDNIVLHKSTVCTFHGGRV